jgi:hypothetical protein
MKEIKRPKTIFCDIDGTLVEHNSPSDVADPRFKLKVLDGTIEKLNEWDSKGYNIILVTGRKESLRFSTEIQLRNVGIFYDKLIMGIGGGERIVINDLKPNSTESTALHFCLKRNEGISNIDV